ncbi:RiPP maturation radical SAM protein 1 [Streptomyces fumigatiscleroticus]|nr:RiPP maturation radical SAM protein 1 [Streptomyces fumigatiscleroticus]
MNTAYARTGRPDVCLVSMPYAALPRPSVGLGLLQAVLEREGISVTTLHANIDFAERVGVHLYELCSSRAPAELLMGEWTFAEAAFPDPAARARDEEYLQAVRKVGRFDGTHRQEGDVVVAALRELRAHTVGFIDRTARRALATGARIIGCTSTFEQHVASLALLRRIRQLDPGVVTMMGGANCETDMGRATHRNFPWVDYVVSGEADGLIADLCRLLLEHGADVPLERLPRGVRAPAHRATPAADRRPLPRAVHRDLDALPTPVYRDYFSRLADSTLADRITPGLPVETSRGCWWGATHQCTFCGLNGSSMAYHAKSPGRVLAELRELEERHALSNFECVDNIMDMSYFPTLLAELAADGRRRSLFYEVKANLSRDQVRALARAGVRWIQPGIESLHTEVLHLMDKGVRGWQNLQLLKWAREFGVRMSWSILWGFPGEKDEYYTTMARWIPYLEHLEPPGGTTRLRYDRYSVYYQQAQRQGTLLSPVPAMGYVYPLAPAELADLAYFFLSDPSLSLGGLDGAGDGPRRPGVLAVRAAVDGWRDRFHRGTRPVLTMTDRDGALHVTDTRRCATQVRRRLTGVARAVLLACDTAPRPERLPDVLARDHGLDVPAEEVSAALSRLTRDGLILRLDGRAVGLPVRGNLPAYPRHPEFPGGYVDTTAPPPRRTAARTEAVTRP